MINALYILTIIFLFSSNLIPAQAQQSNPKIGINLTGPDHWSNELPFIDPLRTASDWVSQQDGKSWGKGPALDLDEHGYIRSLTADCQAGLNLLEYGNPPAGEYTLLYNGKGSFSAVTGAKVIREEPGKVVFAVEGKGMRIQLDAVDEFDPVRNMRMLMPGVREADLAKIWRPEFLQNWKGVEVVRFADYMMTNEFFIRKWEDRPVMEDLTFNRRGVPVELLCDLANKLEADPWFCMPYAANDEYIENFARAVKTHLDPERQIYVEYSHETWNGKYRAKNKWIEQAGVTLGFSEKDKPWEGGWFYYGYRTAEISRLWDFVFRDQKDRIVMVFGVPTNNPYVSRQMLEFQESYSYVDAVAIAPYITLHISPENEADITGMSIEQIFNTLETQGMEKASYQIEEHRKLAEEHGLKLIAYEGGQQIFATKGSENNPEISQMIRQANLHPRMGELHRKLFALWEEKKGDLLMLGLSTGRWEKQRCEGIREFPDDLPEKNPKLRAVIKQAADWGQ